MTDKASEVLYEKSGHIGRVIFNRPEKLNAINAAMYTALFEILDEARYDDDIKVIILKGNGTSFSTGHDLSQAGYVTGLGYGGSATGKGPPERSVSQRSRLTYDFDHLIHGFRYVLLYPKVTIAQVQGWCIGGARTMAESCDLSVVATDAKISWINQRHGHAEGSDLWSALHLGPKKARELGLTGGTLSGQEAADLGWACRAVPLEQLEAETESLAEKVARQPRDGLAIGKARRWLDLESIGVAHHAPAAIVHTLFTNIHFEEDEVNFYKDRRDIGVKDAMHKLNKAFEET